MFAGIRYEFLSLFWCGELTLEICASILDTLYITSNCRVIHEWYILKYMEGGDHRLIVVLSRNLTDWQRKIMKLLVGVLLWVATVKPSLSGASLEYYRYNNLFDRSMTHVPETEEILYYTQIICYCQVCEVSEVICVRSISNGKINKLPVHTLFGFVWEQKLVWKLPLCWPEGQWNSYQNFWTLEFSASVLVCNVSLDFSKLK